MQNEKGIENTLMREMITNQEYKFSEETISNKPKIKFAINHFIFSKYFISVEIRFHYFGFSKWDAYSRETLFREKCSLNLPKRHQNIFDLSRTVIITEE